jgi:hypothetical protein
MCNNDDRIGACRDGDQGRRGQSFPGKSACRSGNCERIGDNEIALGACNHDDQGRVR